VGGVTVDGSVTSENLELAAGGAISGTATIGGTMVWSGGTLYGVLTIAQDWSTHGIGHEITAFYGLDHAQTLAIIWPGVARNRMAGKLAKLVQYGQRVWGLSGADAEVAEAAIEKTEQFFTTVGCPTRLSAYKVDAGEAAKRVSERFVARGQGGIGERGDITTEEVAKIILSRR
jgi:NADP-dependent alcohol dehydrogenase